MIKAEFWEIASKHKMDQLLFHSEYAQNMRHTFKEFVINAADPFDENPFFFLSYFSTEDCV